MRGREESSDGRHGLSRTTTSTLWWVGALALVGTLYLTL